MIKRTSSRSKPQLIGHGSVKRDHCSIEGIGERQPLAMPGWQATAAHATHRLLYALFFIVPLLGWAYSSAAGFPVVLFGVLPLPDFVPVDKALAEAIKPWHERTALLMAALVLLHIAGALKHQFIDRDGLLDRMRPARG